jgi:hypothetical protein
MTKKRVNSATLFGVPLLFFLNLLPERWVTFF